MSYELVVAFAYEPSMFSYNNLCGPNLNAELSHFFSPQKPFPDQKITAYATECFHNYPRTCNQIKTSKNRQGNSSSNDGVH